MSKTLFDLMKLRFLFSKYNTTFEGNHIKKKMFNQGGDKKESTLEI